jgi:hypothetical protein
VLQSPSYELHLHEAGAIGEIFRLYIVDVLGVEAELERREGLDRLGQQVRLELDQTIVITWKLLR